MGQIITIELQDTLRQNPNITEVGFDKSGRHYFRWFKLKDNHFIRNDKGKTVKNVNSKELEYGGGIFSHSEVINSIFNVDKTRESIAKGKPGTEIVEKMTRDEVLLANPKSTSKGIVSDFINATDAEKAMLLQILGITPAKPTTEVETEE